MDEDLKNLIESHAFRQYHKELQDRPLNVFDVLGNADYEIRHSNVLAWLLQPGESHGIGDAFIRKVVGCLRRADGRGRRFEAVFEKLNFAPENVEVERERLYVDITIRFREEKLLLAIENKLDARSPEHGDQVVGYDKKLRRKDPGYRICSVLLTASPEGDESETRFACMSWHEVHEIIVSLCEDDTFRSDRARSFVRQYGEQVERQVLRRESGGDHFGTLLKDHRPVLARLLEERGTGSNALRSGIPSGLRDSVSRLVEDFGREPERWRLMAREFLKGRGFTTTTGNNRPRTAFWLYFSDEAMDRVTRVLDVENLLVWALTLEHRKVEAELYWPPCSKPKQAIVDRLMQFMRSNPVDRSGSHLYPMKGKDYFTIYRRCLLDDDALRRMSTSDVEAETERKLQEFLESDYRTIANYFECLAFDPRAPAAEGTEAATDDG